MPTTRSPASTSLLATSSPPGPMPTTTTSTVSVMGSTLSLSPPLPCVPRAVEPETIDAYAVQPVAEGDHRAHAPEREDDRRVAQLDLERGGGRPVARICGRREARVD